MIYLLYVITIIINAIILICDMYTIIAIRLTQNNLNHNSNIFTLLFKTILLLYYEKF